jgi:hypothetical protein
MTRVAPSACGLCVIALAGCGHSQRASPIDDPRGEAQGAARIARCVGDWNYRSSPYQRANLDVSAAKDAPDVTVAVYRGATLNVERTGTLATSGPKYVQLEEGACIVVAQTYVYFQNRHRSWTSASAAQQFPLLWSNQHWSEEHANARAFAGPLSESPDVSGVGRLTPLGGRQLAIIEQNEVVAPPATATETSGEHSVTSPEASRPTTTQPTSTRVLRPASAESDHGHRVVACGEVPSGQAKPKAQAIMATDVTCADARAIADEVATSGRANAPQSLEGCLPNYQTRSTGACTVRGYRCSSQAAVAQTSEVVCQNGNAAIKFKEITA